MKHDKTPSKWDTYKIGGVFALVKCKGQAENPNLCTLHTQSLNAMLRQL